MNTIVIRKNQASREDELHQAFEKFLSCLPPFREIDFLLDIVHRHCFFDGKYNKKCNLIILGSSIPEELIYAYWILGGS